MARLVVILAATLAAAVGSLAFGTPQAAASSQGCTYTKFPSHYVCFNINGSSTYVSTFAVIRGKLDWDNDICNHRAKVVVRHRGRVIWSRTSSVRPGLPDLPGRPDVRGVSQLPQPVVRLRVVLRERRPPGHGLQLDPRLTTYFGGASG